MKQILVVMFLAILTSCSGGGGGIGERSTKIATGNITKASLSKDELAAKELIKDEMAELQNNKYELPASELQSLVDEGLVSEEELASIMIVQ